MWVTPTYLSSNYLLGSLGAACSSGGTGAYTLWFRLGASFAFGDCGYGGTTFTGIQPVIGTWYFVVGEYDGSDTISYTDLTSSTTAWSGYTFNGAGPWYIGGGQGTSFAGSIANVQIYNTSLSEPEVNALYQEGIGGAPLALQNLVGWWPLNGNANDYSGNNNNGVPSGVTYTSAWTSGYTTP